MVVVMTEQLEMISLTKEKWDNEQKLLERFTSEILLINWQSLHLAYMFILFLPLPQSAQVYHYYRGREMFLWVVEEKLEVIAKFKTTAKLLCKTEIKLMNKYAAQT